MALDSVLDAESNAAVRVSVAPLEPEIGGVTAQRCHLSQSVARENRRRGMFTAPRPLSESTPKKTHSLKRPLNTLHLVEKKNTVTLYSGLSDSVH